MSDLKIIAYSTKHHLKLEPHVDHYLDIYEKYFSPLQELPIKFLEIGVDNGGSLAIWNEYFTRAEIHGIDIVDKRQIKEGKFHLGDQTDENFLLQLNQEFGPFDIILDDGGHKTSQQSRSFDILFPLLNSGGLYIIEDLHTSYWDGFIDSETTTMDKLIQLPHSLNVVHSQRNQCWTPAEYLQSKTLCKPTMEFVHFYDSICIIKKA